MNDIDWSELQLFRHIARAGTLAGAATATGVSAPTLGRQMRALEGRLGRALFLRGHDGYALTPDGRALLERIERMAAAVRSIEDWGAPARDRQIVSISVDSWMSMFLGRRINAVWTTEDPFRLCLKNSAGPVDIERREAIIAIERSRPVTGNVAAVRVGTCADAPSIARSVDQEPIGAWLALAREISQTPAERWTAEKPQTRIAAWANTRGALYDLAVGGAGRALLPYYLGDDDPDLVRAGDVVGEVEDELWLVAHADERRRPEGRAVIDRLTSFFHARRALLSGAPGG